MGEPRGSCVLHSAWWPASISSRAVREMLAYPSTPRSPGGLMTTSSRSRLSSRSSAVLGNRPLVPLPEVQLRSAQGPAHMLDDTFRKVRFINATQVVPSLSDVDAVDDWGWTPLMHAAEQNHKEMHVRKLLAAGCDAVRLMRLHCHTCQHARR